MSGSAGVGTCAVNVLEIDNVMRPCFLTAMASDILSLTVEYLLGLMTRYREKRETLVEDIKVYCAAVTEDIYAPLYLL